MRYLIWIKGTKFRVHDETDRYVDEILEDAVAKRGLGQAPRTIEEIMDIFFRGHDEGKRGATELIGDTATKQGFIHEPGKARWMIEAEKIAPVAEQIFTDGLEERLRPVKTLTRFGRTCTEYQGFVEGEDNGATYKSEITRIVAPPFVFLTEVRDSENRDYYYTREFVEFQEGKVMNADVEPPGAGRIPNPE